MKFVPAPIRSLTYAIVVLLFSVAWLPNGQAHDEDKGIGSSAPPGIGGVGPFSAFNIELISQLPIADIGGGPGNVIGNDIWGWTDNQTGKEYAIFGLTNGTSFIDISDPANPLYLGKLDTHAGTGNTAWRDIKVYNDHAYVVSDGTNQDHGLQVFDLKQLRNVTTPQSFSETAHFDGFGRAHNIAINEQTGFAYVVGSNQASGGLYMIDLNNPASPTFAGSFSSDGYTHDAQAVVYQGPDATYAGREIVLAANVDTLTIVDVSNKAAPQQISRTGYVGSEYSHQGWISDDQKYFFMDDELDERNANNAGNPIQTRTHIWNIEDLDSPSYIGFHDGREGTIDHNQYVKGDFIYQANYTSGLRVLKILDAANGVLQEVAYLDTYPTDNDISFNGAWSVFPFFDSDLIIVSDRQNGLFVARLLPSAIPEPSMVLVPLVIVIALILGMRRRRILAPAKARKGG